MFFVHHILFFREGALRNSPRGKNGRRTEEPQMQYQSACRYYRVTSTDGCQSSLGRSLAPGSNEKNKLYLLTDVIRVLMETPVSQPAEHQDPNKMTAKERKGWFDSERGVFWLEKR